VRSIFVVYFRTFIDLRHFFSVSRGQRRPKYPHGYWSWCVSLLFGQIILLICSEVRVPATTVRLLPYSLVPGMMFSSPLFLKAISVISKQQNSNMESSKVQQLKLSEFTHFLSSFLLF
jgi:hypothetical protein